MIDNIAFRCYVSHDKENDDKSKVKSRYFVEPKPSNSIVLAFDTETTIDAYQNLLFGSCGIWINGILNQFYLFYNEDILKEKEIEMVTSYASKNGYKVLARKDFVEQIFFPYVYKARAKCVGFNLPFDLSRLAVSFTNSRKYVNGFSLKLLDNPKIPNIVIRSLNSKASFIEFTRPLRKKSEQKQSYEHYKGYFVDLRTLTFALTNNSYSLDGALQAFECSSQKTHPDTHGKVTEEYIDYNINDTKSTYELYTKVFERYALYGLGKELNKIYSPASIGKAYLDKIGIKPFFEKNPSFPKELLGKVMSTYYGGRTEVRVRKEPIKIAYLDFTSMYPTVYALLGMDKILKSKNIAFIDSTNETRQIIDSVTLESITDKNLWQRFNTICRINPDNDILPVRSQYESKHAYNIGLNYLKAIDDVSIWYTLPDLIASKFLSGKMPIIEEAITFSANEIQEDLKAIEILKGITVSPNEDFIKKLIEERIRLKQNAAGTSATPIDKKQIKLKQNILKIIANSTSYGIYIEINSEQNDDSDKEYVTVYGLDTFRTSVDRIEQEGKAFNPIMATFITSSARLLIACAESLVYQNIGRYAYCDTDSVLVSSEHVSLVQKFFKPLNPYSEDVEIFKVEEDEIGKLDNVWFYGISAKRYVLYDYNEDTKEITIRKHSAHGLGHLQNINEKQWWKDILTIHYNPESKQQIVAKYQNQYAFSQLTISNYMIMKRFAPLNDGKDLKRKIKPFNFITVGNGYRQNSHTKNPIIPMLPFVNPKRAKEIPFMEFVDYRTGAKYPNDSSMQTEYYWKPLSEVFEDYIDHTEAKSSGEHGLLHRRHMQISSHSIHYIGKESNDLDLSEVLGITNSQYIQYSDTDARLKDVILRLTSKDALKLGLSINAISYLKHKITTCYDRKQFRLNHKTRLKLLQLLQ